MNRIQSDILKVDFRFQPDKPLYHRFETIGVVSQVEYKGKHVFCEPEQRIPERFTCEGIGLCGEYAFNTAAECVDPGEWYMKPGIGGIRKPLDPAFSGKYECRPFVTSAEWGPDHAVFTQEPENYGGYAARIIKRMSVHGNILRSEVTMENCGDRRMELAEYQHNFVSVDRELIGPDYELQVPFVTNLHDLTGHTALLADRSPVSGIIDEKDGRISWNRSMAEGYTYIMISEANQIDTSKGHYWMLKNRNKGAYVSEKFCFEPCRTVIWGIEHCMCVEVYAPVNIAPGEKYTWIREWEFGELN